MDDNRIIPQSVGLVDKGNGIMAVATAFKPMKHHRQWLIKVWLIVGIGKHKVISHLGGAGTVRVKVSLIVRFWQFDKLG